jgi:hypothetical protein
LPECFDDFVDKGRIALRPGTVTDLDFAGTSACRRKSPHKARSSAGVPHDLDHMRADLARIIGAMPHAMTVMFTVVLYGLPLSISLSVLILVMLVRNPRLLLHSYPKDVRAAVPPKSPVERCESSYWAAMFLVLAISFPFAAALASKTSDRTFLETFLIAFGVTFLFNLVDWLILDWLIFCTITPEFAVVPGTAGMAGYKNYAIMAGHGEFCCALRSRQALRRHSGP